MPVQDQKIQYPLFLGRDGGSDDKIVRQALVEAKNVIHDSYGAVSKRPGMTEILDNTGNDQAVVFHQGIIRKQTKGFSADEGTEYNRQIPYNQVSVEARRLGFCGENTDSNPIRAFYWDKGPANAEPTTMNGHNCPQVQVENEFDPVSKSLTLTDASTSIVIDRYVTYNVSTGAITGVPDGPLTGRTTGAAAPRFAPLVDSCFVSNGGTDYYLLTYIDASDNIVLRSYSIDGSGVLSAVSNEAVANGTELPDYAIKIVCVDGASWVKVFWQDNTGGGSEVPGDLYVTEWTNFASLSSGANSSVTLDTDFATDVRRISQMARVRPSDVTSINYLYVLSAADYTESGGDRVDELCTASVSSSAVTSVDGPMSLPGGSDLLANAFRFSSGSTRNYLWLRLGTVINDGDYTVNQEVSSGVLLGDVGGTFDHVASYAYLRELTGRSTLNYSFDASTWYSFGKLSDPQGTTDRVTIYVVAGGGVSQVCGLTAEFIANGTGFQPVAPTYDYALQGPGPVREVTEGTLIGRLHPRFPILSSSNGAGALTNSGVYGYALVPYISVAGRYIQGEPSNTISITLGASDDTVSITLGAEDVFGLFTNQENTTIWAVYRTQDAAGTLQFAGLWDGSGTFTDLLADSALGANIYTNDYLTGAVHELPPPARDITFHGGRLWLLPSDDPTRLWYTLRRGAGSAGQQEGPSFSVQGTIDLPLEGIRIIPFGGLILVFGKDQVWGIPGDGPDEQFVGDFGRAQFLVGVPGLEDKASLVYTEQGKLVWKAKKGWMMMDRGFNATYVGRPVEDYHSTAVKSAVARDDAIVQFLLSDDTTCLAFDSEHEQWHVWEYGVSLGHIIPYEGGALAGTTKTWADTEGNFTDDGTSYTMTLETRWFTADEFAGFVRFREVMLLGEWKSSHSIRVSVYYDYDRDTVVEQQTLALTSDTDPYILRFQPARQQGKAMKLVFEELTPAGTEEAATFTGLTLTVAVEPKALTASTETF